MKHMQDRLLAIGRCAPVGLAVLLLCAVPARAAVRDGALRVEVVSAYNLVVDSNAGTPSSYAPRAAYIGVTLHNDGATDLTDILAHIGNYNDGVGPTPGIYPSRTHPGLTGPLDGGAFAFRHEGGRAGLSDATRYIATIPAGESVTVYWLIGYDQLDVNGTPLWGTSVKPDDDLWLEYDVWATAGEGGTERTVDLTRKLTFRNEISASANKIFPNGANKVPDYYKEVLNQYQPAWTNASYDGSVGTRVVTEGIWYDFGNVGAGFDNNGDLVPDRNAWMQPVGDPTLFDAGAFRLVKTYAMVIVKLTTGGEIVLTGEDQLYFENIPENNGAVGYVRYEFVPLVPNARSVTTPYQEVASGYDNEKFNADYGVSLGEGLLSGEAQVGIDKTADRATVPAGGAVAYTVAYTNAGSVAAGDPAFGLPLVVQDSIPDGTAYVSGSATASNALPVGVGAYTVFYSTDNGGTWTLEEPPAASVTDIQWWLSDALPAGSAGVVRFSVTVDSPYLEAAPVVVNEAGVSYGDTPPFATDDATTLVLGSNSLGDTVYADTGSGTGGILGNGAQDGTEAGIAGVSVLLYYDANSNGVADAEDPLYGLAITGTDGKYLFSNLPDGNYVAVLDQDDAQLPEGYTTTTPVFHAIDLDNVRANPAAVSNLTADFGLAPALAATKVRVGTGALREGGRVDYQIAVTNRLAGSGSPTPQPFAQLVWPSNGSSPTGNKGWLTPANAWKPGEPDKTYTTAPFDNAGEELNLTGYAGSSPFGAITNVELLLPIRVTGSFAGSSSTLAITLWKNGSSLGTRTFNGVDLPAAGTLSVNVTAMQAGWAWSDFNGTALQVQLIANKQGNPTVSMDLDSAGFLLTTDRLVGGTDATTLDPVPLVDNYDTTRLQYVSSVPAADTVTTNATVGEIRWNNLGPIYAGGGRLVTVMFEVLEPPGNITALVTNTAAITNAWFANGRRANDQYGTNIATVLPAGTIGDRVWRDLDTDGVQDAGEPGVAGVTVTITPPAGVNLGYGPGVASNTVTDANGFYLFDALPASGNYTVAVTASTLPGGSGTPTWDYDGVGTAHQAVIPLVIDSTTGADTVLESDFGYNLQSMIRGTLWHDVDRDGSGAPEAGEDRLAGVTVQLRDSGGTVIATTTTGSLGTFQFVGVTSGSYTVTVVPSSGPLATGAWTGTFDTDGLATAHAVAVTVPSGGLGIADFSYALTGTLVIGDTVFYDWNGNGTQDAGMDGGVDGVRVLLYQDEDADGVVDAGVDAWIAETATATNGVYRFDFLPPGTYQVAVETTAEHLQSTFVVTADPDSNKDGISVVTLTTADNLIQDFGFQPSGYGSIGDTVWYDSNGDGVQLGAMEPGIAGVAVWLYADLDADGSYFLVRTAVTDASGHYLFSSLPDGAYRVVVDTASEALPIDAFGDPSRATTPAAHDVTLAGVSHLDADFGFVLPGAIGDTVWWDYNGNADQDWTEPGIPGVTVRLYVDANANGVFDTGEERVDTQVTDADGKYIFHNLLPDHYVVVVDGFSAPLAGATLTGDPDNDGVPCPVPAVLGPSCDGQYGVRLTEESTFRGADFGYQPPGVIGDTLWIDGNTNGVQDAGEPGIPYVTVSLYTNGILLATQETDGDGIYLFGGLGDGIYQVVVEAGDPDLHADLAPVYDADGLADGVATNIVISGGSIVSVGGHSVTNADLAIDFGYRFSGTNVVSGTVGLDAEPHDGLMNGLITTGVAAGEYPFAGVPVYLYLWDDDGDDAVEPGETLLIASTPTDAAGDYRFAGLPAGDGNDRYLVSLAAPASAVRLTTVTGDTTALAVVNTTNSLGNTLSAYQTLAIVPVRDNIDFAFESTRESDFGDLPVTYSTTVADRPIGPSHVQVPGQPLHLGRRVATERNGKPTPDATGDGDEEDGVAAVGRWTDGGNSGHVEITVGAGSGWLCGWIDFNQDGTFTNASELVISQAVDSQGTGVVYALSFPIPEGTFRTDAVTVLNARFRLYPTRPLIPLFAGEVAGGEVEDYQYIFGAIGDRTWFDANKNGLQDAGETAMTNVTVRLYDAADTLLGTEVSDASGSYRFTGLTTGTYYMVFSASTNYSLTAPQAGGAALDSDPATNGVTSPIVMATAAFTDDVDAGFTYPTPLSSAIDLRAYQGADGVYVEFVAYDVEADGVITLYLLGPGGTVIWRGTVEVRAGPRQVCRFRVPGLAVGGAYDFAVRDEVGKLWRVYGVPVGQFAAEMVRMSLAGITPAFDSLPDRDYEIQWTPQLGKPWRTVTNVPSHGGRTSVLVAHPDPTSPSGFFRIRVK